MMHWVRWAFWRPSEERSVATNYPRGQRAAYGLLGDWDDYYEAVHAAIAAPGRKGAFDRLASCSRKVGGL